MHEKKEKDSGELCGKELQYLSTYQDTGCRDLKAKSQRHVEYLNLGGKHK